MLFKKAVLIIHGFSANTSETEYLRNYLEYNSNFDVFTFTLPGHDKLILNNVKHEQWIDESVRQMEILIKKYNTIYVVGHSMGGVIATYLATRYTQIKKLVLLAPAFIYFSKKQNKEGIIDKIKNKGKRPNGLYSEVVEKIVRVPLKSFVEFTMLVKKYYSVPKYVCCDTLIIQGDKDEIVPIASSEYVYNNLKSNKKYLTIIRDTYHKILTSEKKEVASSYIYKFLKGGFPWIRAKKSEI